MRLLAKSCICPPRAVRVSQRYPAEPIAFWDLPRKEERFDASPNSGQKPDKCSLLRPPAAPARLMRLLPTLFTGVDVLNAVSLILKSGAIGPVERHPAAVCALILVHRDHAQNEFANLVRHILINHKLPSGPVVIPNARKRTSGGCTQDARLRIANHFGFGLLLRDHVARVEGQCFYFDAVVSNCRNGPWSSGKLLVLKT